MSDEEKEPEEVPRRKSLLVQRRTRSTSIGVSSGSSERTRTLRTRAFMSESEKEHRSEEREPLTPEKFRELVEEGARLAEKFDRATRPMRILTPEDWLRRCR